MQAIKGKNCVQNMSNLVWFQSWLNVTSMNLDLKNLRGILAISIVWTFKSYLELITSTLTGLSTQILSLPTSVLIWPSSYSYEISSVLVL